MIERQIQTMVLGLYAAPGNAGWQRGGIEDRGEIDAFGFPMLVGHSWIDLVDAADHLIDGTEAELSHVLPHLLGEEEEEIDDVLGLAGKARTQDRVLGGNAHRAGIEVAFAHHDAAHGDERRGGKAELFSAEQGGDHNIAARL